VHSLAIDPRPPDRDRENDERRATSEEAHTDSLIRVIRLPRAECNFVPFPFASTPMDGTHGAWVMRVMRRAGNAHD
jgi:hypothetical protein